MIQLRRFAMIVFEAFALVALAAAVSLRAE
jgi:hypothetical protein